MVHRGQPRALPEACRGLARNRRQQTWCDRAGTANDPRRPPANAIGGSGAPGCRTRAPATAPVRDPPAPRAATAARAEQRAQPRAMECRLLQEGKQPPLYEALAEAFDFSDPDLWRSNTLASLRPRLVIWMQSVVARLECDVELGYPRTVGLARSCVGGHQGGPEGPPRLKSSRRPGRSSPGRAKSSAGLKRSLPGKCKPTANSNASRVRRSSPGRAKSSSDDEPV